VLENGELTEQGQHETLLEAGATYARFWRERTEAAGWRLIGATAQIE
jgi:ATP-binding cassette, subfamily B, bacterial IrtB/YbtQ